MIKWSFWLLFGILSVAPSIMAIGFLVLGDGNQFQRTGSAMVAGAVLSLAWLKIKEREFETFYHEQADIGVAMHLAHRWGMQSVLASKLAFWFEVWVIAIGTMVSGFGDLFFSWLWGNPSS